MDDNWGKRADRAGKAKRIKAKSGEKMLVTLLLDRSYSMQGIREQTITGVNDWIATMRRSKGDIRLSLVMFDSHAGRMHLEKLFVARPISEVVDLRWDEFVPRGGTPLIDAAVDTICAVRESLRGRDARAVIAIQTDGEENESRRNSWEQLRGLIAECEGQGYQFQFIGAGINAYDQGRRMGLGRDQIMSYGKDRAATRAAFSASAANTVAFAEGLSLSTAYSPVQKMAAGDRYDGAVAAPAGPVPRDIPNIASPAFPVGNLPGYGPLRGPGMDDVFGMPQMTPADFPTPFPGLDMSGGYPGIDLAGLSGAKPWIGWNAGRRSGDAAGVPTGCIGTPSPGMMPRTICGPAPVGNGGGNG